MLICHSLDTSTAIKSSKYNRFANDDEDDDDWNSPDSDVDMPPKSIEVILVLLFTYIVHSIVHLKISSIHLYIFRVQ